MQNSNLPNNFILEAAEKYGDQPAIVLEDKILNFRQLYSVAISGIKLLSDWRIQRGDRAAIIAPNSLEYVIFLLSCWMSGVIAVPLNIRWKPEQIRQALQSINCSKLVLPKSQMEKFSSFCGDKYDFSEWGRLFETCDLPIKSRCQTTPLDQNGTILFTSGSTGLPKAVLHTIGNHLYSALGSNQNISFGSGDRWLIVLPFYHVGGLAVIFRAMVGGGAMVIPSQDISLEEIVLRTNFTHISLVATQLYRLVKNEQCVSRLKKLKAILLGGSAIPPALISDAIKLKLPVLTSYGSTEMSSQITTTAPNDPPSKLFTSGKPLQFREVKISKIGEILVKGQTLFRGYIKGDQIEQVTDSQGWFRTGDIGEFDETGYLNVKGRIDNMFISGGENIHPEYIERFLQEIPAIEEAIVVPISNEEFGKRPVAFVKSRKKMPLKKEEILNFLKENIPRFMIPDYFLEWPDQVETSGLKIDRVFLAKLAEDRIKHLKK